MLTLTIEKMVFGGQGLARLDGKACFVWNALPGEVVEAELLKNKKDYCEAIATKILTASPDRIEPKEDHYLSCSPWQIVSWNKENEWKREMAIETYRKVGGLDLTPDIVNDEDEPVGYRNKMEYSFAEQNGKIVLALFERGKKHREGNSGCVLAKKELNAAAQIVLDWVNEQKITTYSLKSMIIRVNTAGEAIVGLFIKDKMKFPSFPAVGGVLAGFELWYSTHRSPASQPTELIYRAGKEDLTEQILDAKLSYGLFSFFQIHIPIFNLALADIAKYIPANSDVLDFYSGVGSISLPLKPQIHSAILADNCREAIQYAEKNIALNKASGYTAEAIPAEKMLNCITADRVVIVDPPRAGMHEDVVIQLNEVKPETIIYLSCNLSTQARDLKMLMANYDIVFSRLYNFFPRTPHVEGLVVLKRK